MKTLSSFVLAFCFATVVSAQERVIDKAEFDVMVTEGHSHRLKWQSEKYRMTVTTSSKVPGRPQTDYSSKSLVEFGPSKETRTIITSVFAGKPAVAKESLRIGNWQYTRSGNEAWIRKEYAPTETPVSKEKEESLYQELSSQAEYRYRGEGKLMDQPVRIFVTTNREKKVSQKNGQTSETESKTTYWVDSKGLILKSEFTAENRAQITSQTSVIMEWQIDPSIKFTAPDIIP